MRWTCYLDESGTHAASPILVMGAAVATESQWQIFDRQWEAVLSREQLPYIHYVDFVGRRKKYRKYSTPDIERIGAELAHIAITTAPVTVSSILRFDDYRSIYKVEETLRFNPSSPLGILFRATASVLPSYIVEAGLDDRPEIDFVYEAGAPNEGDIRGLYELLKMETLPDWGGRLGSLRFVKKGSARGLELADAISFASLRMERKEHGDQPTLVEVSSYVMGDDAQPPANGIASFRVPISRSLLTDLKDNLLLGRRQRGA